MKRNTARRDTRRFDRLGAVLPVTVRAAGNKVAGGLRLESSNLSEAGAFLHSDLLFEVGEDLEIEIPLPSGDRVRARGRVVRVWRDSEREGSAGMGIAFTRLAAAERRAIAALIDGRGSSAASTASR